MSILSAVISRGVLASRPAAGSPGRVYFVTDGTPGLYRDNGSSWDSIGESGAAVTWADLDDDHDAHDHTGVPGVGGGGSSDPILDVFGAASTSYDPAGILALTAMGTPTNEDANTTLADHYYVRDNNASIDWCGRYTGAPSAPFTVITDLSSQVRANYQRAALFIGVAAPGSMDALGALFNNDARVALERVTPTGGGSNIATPITSANHMPRFFAIRVVSATDVDYLFSFDGYTWRYASEARNPSITIGSIGVAMKTETATPLGVGFRFLRVFTSAKTFPGVD